MNPKIVFLALLALLLLSGCSQPSTSAPDEGGQAGGTLPAGTGTGAGTLVLSLTDQPSGIEEYKELNVTISEIEVHKTGTEWMVFSDEVKTFNLFELNGVKELLGEKELEAGKYTGIRLKVDKVELIEEEEGEEEIYDVKVPSERIILVKNFDVLENQELELVLDFDPYSVVVEANEYILKPAIKILSLSEFDEKVEKIKEEKEKQEEEAKKVSIKELVFPSSAGSGETIEFSWKVQSGKDYEIPHTAVHWDLTGGHGENFEEYENAGEVLQGRTNDEFTTSIALPQVTEETTLFFRVHAIADKPVGETTPAFESEHVYSDEMGISILPSAESQEVKEFEVLSNDSVFEPSAVSAMPGDLVRITFTVDTTGVSFGGEKIESDYFEIDRLAPGESHTFEFTMPETSFTVRSFWPSTSIFKASMQVNAETG